MSKAKHIDADREAMELLDGQLARAATERVPELITLGLFVAFIAAFALAFWIVPDRDMSEEENRALEQFPEISVQSVVSGEFTEKFASYMADLFPLRDQFVGVKAASEIVLGKRENNSIIVLGDTLAERFDDVNTENFERNITAIDAFIAACRARGVTAEFAVFGRAMDVTSIPVYGSGTSDAAWAKLDGHNHIDMRRALDGHGGEYVYYRTDHHHTSLGAYYAYAYLAPRLGYEANDIGHYRRETLSEEFFGTTYSKSGAKWIAPDSVEAFRWEGDGALTVNVDGGKSQAGLYFSEYLDKKDKYSVFLGGNNARVDITSPPTSERQRAKLLIVKDSFAHSLVPFLAEHFDVTMIDPRYYKRPIIRLVEDEGFDAVLVCCNMDTLSSAAPFAILRSGLK